MRTGLERYQRIWAGSVMTTPARRLDRQLTGTPSLGTPSFQIHGESLASGRECLRCRRALAARWFRERHPVGETRQAERALDREPRPSARRVELPGACY